MKKLIYLEDAIDAICKKCKADYPDTTACDICDDISILKSLPSAEPEQRWSRLMMHLADLQLTYSPNWGANGQGDQKLYDFVTGLIEELEGWEDKPPTEPEQRWIPVTERLPEKDGRYLITGIRGTVYPLAYEDGRWYGGIRPVAWMPLPEAYSEPTCNDDACPINYDGGQQ